MTTEAWLLLVLVVLVAYCGSKLSEVASGVEDIRDRLKHVHPIGKHEREEIEEEADF